MYIYIDVVFFKKYPCDENDTHTKEITFYIYIYIYEKKNYLCSETINVTLADTT